MPTPPDLSADHARELVRELYGLDVEARDLPSSEDRNFLLEHASGRRWVLKIARPAATFEALDLENRAIEHVAARGVAAPRVCSTLDGERIAALARVGETRHVRLLTYLPGAPWSAGVPRPGELARRLGRFAGELDHALEDFSHPALTRANKWDLRHTLELRRHLGALPAPRRDAVERAFGRFEGVVPRWSALRAGVIHGDVNNDNVLVTGDGSRIAGVIDFADVVRTATVCEVAIAMAYAMLGHPEPLVQGGEVLRGYHRVRPLEAVELDVLLDLILARLAMNLTLLFALDGRDPGNAYLKANREAAGRLLAELLEHDPGRVRASFEACCGAAGSNRGRSVRELLEVRRRHLGASLSIAYRKPLKIVRGAGPYLIDERGRAYLDAVNNVNHVGHCHPRVVAAAHAQNARLNTNTRYLHDALVEYAERLAATFPEPLEVCYLVNSGSEANDLALRLARAATGHRDAVVVDGAYHGTTVSAVALSPYKFDGPGGGGRAPWVHVAPTPDAYRGRFKADDPRAGGKYAADVARAIERAAAERRRIAAFFCESMISCGGQVIPPPGYLRAAYRHVRDAGGLCVADEVQVGFGRPGSAFWAFETQGVVPDIVTLGKPIGNGHPLSAVVTNREVADAFANGMEYFNTFGGNPVSCAVGLAVLDVVAEEGLQDNARVVGAHLLARLRGLAERHELIGDVRGHGLFLGVELVRDRETLEPAADEATAVIEAMRDRGVLLSSEGPFHNVLKIKPPMVWTTVHADLFAETLDEALGTSPF